VPDIDRATALCKRISECFDPAMWRRWCFLAAQIAGHPEVDPNAMLDPIPEHIESEGFKRLARIGVPYGALMEFWERSALSLRRSDADDLLLEDAALRAKLVAEFSDRGTRGDLVASYFVNGELRVAKPEAWIYAKWDFDSVSMRFPDGTIYQIFDVRENVAKTADRPKKETKPAVVKNAVFEWLEHLLAANDAEYFAVRSDYLLANSYERDNPNAGNVDHVRKVISEWRSERSIPRGRFGPGYIQEKSRQGG